MGKIDEAEKKLLALAGMPSHDEIDAILAPLVEAVETTEMLLRLCDRKAFGRTGCIYIAPSPEDVEVTICADVYGIITSGKTLHAALVKAMNKTGEQR
jgi:hypothetical protein